MLIQLLKSKTVWFAIILAVLSVVQGYVHLIPVTPEWQMIIGIIIAIIVTILRIVTTQPISDK